MTNEEITTLESFAIHGDRYAYRQSKMKVSVLSSLIRQGMLEKQRNSEHVRGERRRYWTEYRLTAAGKDFLRKVREKACQNASDEV